jgi:hypothetical protein
VIEIAPLMMSSSPVISYHPNLQHRSPGRDPLASEVCDFAILSLAFVSSPESFTADHSQGISRHLQSLVTLFYETVVYTTSHILPAKPSSTIYASSCTHHLRTIVYLPPVNHLGYHVAHALVCDLGNSVYHIANLQKPTTLLPAYYCRSDTGVERMPTL